MAPFLSTVVLLLPTTMGVLLESAKDIAEQANALFAKEDDGVYFRMVKADLVAIDQDKSSETTMSFSLLNKIAWLNNIIQLFGGGNTPAIIAKPDASKLVK